MEGITKITSDDIRYAKEMGCCIKLIGMAHMAEKGIEVVASAVGEILTVQETAGFQMFIARMDDELLGYWNAPCRTPYYRN